MKTRSPVFGANTMASAASATSASAASAEDENDMLDYLWQLEHLPYNFYLWQEEQLQFDSYFNRGPIGRRLFMEQAASGTRHLKKFMDAIKPRDLGGVKCYTYSELKNFTNDFSDENFIGKTYTGRLFRVKPGHVFDDREATIKIWDFPQPIPPHYCYHTVKFHGELVFLSEGISQYTYVEPLSHPNLVKLVGYSFNKVPAVVYDLQSEKCVRDLVTSDSFDWKARMKLAIQIADLLCYLHGEGIAIRSITSGNIMIDKDGEAKLFAIALMAAHDVVVELEQQCLFYEGYAFYSHTPEMSVIRRDIYMYGFMLLELLTKQVGVLGELKDSVEKCRDSFVEGKRFVHEDLNVDDATASIVAALALECVDPIVGENLVMTDIIEKLHGVNV